MATPNGGYQPRNTPAERRAFFEVERKLRSIPAENVIFDPPVSGVTADPPTVQATFEEFATNTTVDMPQRFLPSLATGMDASSLRVMTILTRWGLSFARLGQIFGSVRNSTGVTLTSGSVVATFPVGARPATDTRILGVNANTGDAVSCIVRTNGDIETQVGGSTILNTHELILSGGWLVAP